MNRVEFILANLSEKILDIGFYCCTLHERVLEKFKRENVYGVDIEVTEETNYYKKASGEKIPFSNKEFDSLLAGEVLEHVENPDNFIKECNRLLKENGKLIITTPNRNSWLNKLTHCYETEIHISLHNWKELNQLLQRNGFEIEKAEGMSYTEESSEGSQNKWFFPIRKFVNFFMPIFLRENMVVLARKVSDRK